MTRMTVIIHSKDPDNKFNVNDKLKSLSRATFVPKLSINRAAAIANVEIEVNPRFMTLISDTGDGLDVDASVKWTPDPLEGNHSRRACANRRQCTRCNTIIYVS